MFSFVLGSNVDYSASAVLCKLINYWIMTDYAITGAIKYKNNGFIHHPLKLRRQDLMITNSVDVSFLEDFSILAA